MEEVNRPEGDEAWKFYDSSLKIAWKTGTSFGNRDAWAIGTNSKYVVGIWVGNATGEGRPTLTGVTSAAPILFDAGHGGYDSGVNKYGFEEKTITESIARKIKEQNNNENVQIVLIRDEDISMNLTDRVTIINKLKPDLVLSIHINSNSNMKANGVNAYISSNKTFYDESKKMAEIAVDKITSTGKLTKRYVAEAPLAFI